MQAGLCLHEYSFYRDSCCCWTGEEVDTEIKGKLQDLFQYGGSSNKGLSTNTCLLLQNIWTMITSVSMGG